MIKQKQGYILRKVIGEYMLFPTGEEMQQFKGTVIMNELAVFIWKTIQVPVDMDFLVAKILGEYDVTKEQVENDLKEILKVLNEYGVIEYV